MANTLRVGDSVKWAGNWGCDNPETAVVTGMEVTALPREKYGTEVDEVDWSQVDDNRVVFTLDNGHWAYSEQISRL
jgi:hypothetical protein